jgi:NAD(P)-dependent dehydrogenase (short-subunit alcohol dehydrogenase family)
MNFFGLDDSVTLVTGGGSGIGRSICVRFAAAGARLVVLDRDAAAADETARLIAEAGGHATAVSCDVSDHAAVHTTVDGILAEYERIDILVNNAGIAHVGSLENTTPADLDRI